jgi:hypothetical protein
MSLLRRSQRIGLLSTLNPLHVTTQGQVWLFSMIPSHNEGNTNFLSLNYNLGRPRAAPNYLEDESLIVTNTNIDGGEYE